MVADITLIPGRSKKCGKQGYILENNLLCIKCVGKMIIKRLKSNKWIEPTAKTAAHPSRYLPRKEIIMSLKKWKMREYSLRVKRRVASGTEKEKLTQMLRLVRNRIKEITI